MMDVRKQKNFYYSQNSLNTFLRCPLKFKYKYMEGIQWKRDEAEYYENMSLGLDFHLLAERYFTEIPCHIPSEIAHEEQLSSWMNRLKRTVPLEAGNRYLPEYEIRMAKGHLRLQAKYDLLLLKPEGTIEIWDWKTEEREITMKEAEKKIQTMVYLYVLAENAEPLLQRKPVDGNIKMIYWQPHIGKRLEIYYNREKHLYNEKKINEILEKLEEYDFSNFLLSKGHGQNCSYCEFKNLCGSPAV